MPPDSRLLKEAADWAMLFRYGTPGETEHAAFATWRQRSQAHEAAWSRAQGVFEIFGQVPDGAGKTTLKALTHNQGRRRSLRTLGMLVVGAPAAWLAWRQIPWQAWRADVATATGERRTLTLPDGSQLVLNTASAVDIAFTAEARRIRLLAGEILITTQPDPAPAPRPFLIDTPQGVVRALGTRFSVRRLDDDNCRVAVFDKAVEIHTLNGETRILNAGEGTDFGLAGIAPTMSVDAHAMLWEQGMLLTKDMRLADVLAELARHRRGVLRCAPEIAELHVSGAISLSDTDAGLALLERSLPLRIERLTRYWVTVVPRHD